MKNKLKGMVYINGEYLKADEAKISAFDRGFIFGDGIYEVVPVINQCLVDRDDFWDRFKRSLNEIQISIPYSKQEFEEILNNVIKLNNLKEGGIYMQVTRGVAPRTFEFVTGLTPSVFIFTYEADIINNQLAQSGIKVVSVEDIRWKRRDIKSISLLAQCYAKNKAVKRGAFEGIMLENGYVSEACSSSVFIIKNNTLITKPLSNEILPGIRRKVLLNLANECGLKVELRNFTIDELYDADEAFISAATLVLLPINNADNKTIKLGKYAQILRQKYVQRLLDESKSTKQY
ncbi:D-amino acid aminotransferase [Campylobacter majalis]|uniref:D-amino acid aminotransferase n=1 Tax=Campylobacter majalis TaxID=2790656 RepID=UPI003D686211